MKPSQNKPKKNSLKLNMISKKPLNKLKPVPDKEKPNITNGPKKITNYQLISPPLKKESDLFNICYTESHSLKSKINTLKLLKNSNQKEPDKSSSNHQLLNQLKSQPNSTTKTSLKFQIYSTTLDQVQLMNKLKLDYKKKPPKEIGKNSQPP